MLLQPRSCKGEIIADTVEESKIAGDILQIDELIHFLSAKTPISLQSASLHEDGLKKMKTVKAVVTEVH